MIDAGHQLQTGLGRAEGFHCRTFLCGLLAGGPLALGFQIRSLSRGRAIRYLLRGTVETWMPWSTFTVSCFVPFFMFNCRVIKKSVWLSEALSVNRAPSLGSITVLIVFSWSGAGMTSKLPWQY